jgi:hypothetical protein
LTGPGNTWIFEREGDGVRYRLGARDAIDVRLSGACGCARAKRGPGTVTELSGGDRRCSTLASGSAAGRSVG